MTLLNQIYKCDVCGNIVEVIRAGAGELVCCGQTMSLQAENTVDAAKEKHVPVIEKNDKGSLVKIGSEPHPMEANHYIEWIELVVGGKIFRQYLKPGDEPKSNFCHIGENIKAREYCNLHGLWSA